MIFDIILSKKVKKKSPVPWETMKNHRKTMVFLRISKNSVVFYFDTFGEAFSSQNDSNELILVPRRSQEDAQNGSKEPLGRPNWMTGRQFCLDFWLLKPAELIFFLFLFIKNWFLIAFCKKKNKKETSRTLKSIENHWKTIVFQGFPEISVFRILMFSGAFFLFKMLPTVLFWCPNGPRMRPKGIPRGCIGRSHWMIWSSYCFDFWFLKQSGHIFLKFALNIDNC